MPARGTEYIHGQTKRSLDIVGAAALSALLAPAAALTGAEIALERRRFNPMFMQQRVGKDGSEFTLYKFQSLRIRHAAGTLLLGAGHTDASKAGLLIRKAGLDEIPQLVNVLRGDMSLVGIRPVPREHLDHYRTLVTNDFFDDWYTCYRQNPGLTGEGQLFSNQFPEHTPAVLRERMEIDIDAFHNASLGNDLGVLTRTPATLLQRLVLPGMSSPERVAA